MLATGGAAAAAVDVAAAGLASDGCFCLPGPALGASAAVDLIEMDATEAGGGREVAAGPFPTADPAPAVED